MWPSNRGIRVTCEWHQSCMTRERVHSYVMWPVKKSICMWSGLRVTSHVNGVMHMTLSKCSPVWHVTGSIHMWCGLRVTSHMNGVMHVTCEWIQSSMTCGRVHSYVMWPVKESIYMWCDPRVTSHINRVMHVTCKWMQSCMTCDRVHPYVKWSEGHVTYEWSHARDLWVNAVLYDMWQGPSICDVTCWHVNTPKHITHTNESWHTCEGAMSHIEMSHVTHVNESCHTYGWVMLHVWMSHVTYMNEPHTRKGDVNHISEP